MNRDSKNRYVAFAFSRGDVLLEIDHAGTIVFATGTVRGFFGIDPAQLLGKPLGTIVAGDTTVALDAVLSAARSRQRVLKDLVLQVGGRRVAGNLAGCPLPDATGYYLSFSAQFDRPRQASERSNKPPADAARDPASGLLRADALAAQAGNLLSQATATEPAPKLTLVDVPGADGLLATLPRERRDSIERELAETLRSYSVAHDSAAKIADNKFGVVHDPSVDPKVIGRGVSDVLKRAAPDGADVSVILSSLDLDDSGMNANDTAKALVYAVNRFADSSGGDFTIASLKDALGKELDTAMTKVADFRRFIDEKGFRLFFQPIIALGDGRPHHQEALTRLPDGSSPFSTVTFAEEVGLISDLDYSVAERVLVLLEQQPTAIDIAINLSGRSLENAAFISVLLELLARYPQLRHRLMIEVTESSRIKNLEKVGKVIQSIRSAGHKVCLDDFGSGSAAFQYLRYLNVDVIKIDGLYVREIHKNPNDRRLVKTIKFLCRELKCESVAEMIEEESQAGILREIGIDYGQGYLFAKPSDHVYSNNRNKSAFKPSRPTLDRPRA